MGISKTNIFTLLLAGVLFCSCSLPNKKVVVYINSYHKGHPSSDEIMEGFISNMPADSFEIHSYYMDTKHNPDKEFILNKARQLFDSIQHLQPDLLVVSDDNAVKYIVEPNTTKLQMPVIFCGVNWSAKDYDLPKDKVCGILEILPIEDALAILKEHYPGSKNILILNENTTTSQKEKQILDTLFQAYNLSPTFQLVDNFEQWKTAFEEANHTFDMIYVSTHAAIKGWNSEEAQNFVAEKITIPVFTCEDFMIPYAVLGVSKIAEEHGIWVADQAKKIIAGTSPEEIPRAKNKQSNTLINVRLADKIGFKPNPEVVKKAIFTAKNQN